MIKYPWETPPAAGDAIEVAPGVLWMRLPLPMALDHVNVYALDDGDSWTVIDTGFASKRGRELWQTLLDGPLAGKPVSRVVVTHHHPDHVGLAGWFMAQGATLAMSQTSWLMSRMLTLDVQESYPPETLTFYQRAGMSPDVFAKRQSDRPFNFSDCVDPLPLGYLRLVEGQTIAMGGRTWDIRMGNGHAPEHATFWSRDDNLVIGGDQLLPSISPNLGVYPTEPEADPVTGWIEACERFQPFADENQLVLGGHKLPFTGLPDRLRQMIENHHSALDRLLVFLSKPKTAGDCFPALFKRQIGEGEYGLALVESVAHVNHLHQAGKVSRTLNTDGAWEYQSLS
ncbi:MBL fold metallo-hydrolase [Yoonia sediminilitoris]|uniref:Glyoxylase-like metal-dependent hydrolase (Beta-lactamase superfamily II) n=1 Tax=Yoonia sediminilitoris TaxID=1286148 RepID=A0A2T6KIE3_9RHOB|nr:MBL fold metallo-hydrolase [Yoonia sediminilitoris]PUB15493.1 glyoxylase-like metal-dependent hydrolase (beta-lactamase superfamily II) [Yoonia sediminilitoris]RCW96103.1 glyoxylase-like metal-dependent hydrolase (beta-lactamase superfamily II) [Yoonia sediminilitoris]